MPVINKGASGLSSALLARASSASVSARSAAPSIISKSNMLKAASSMPANQAAKRFLPKGATKPKPPTFQRNKDDTPVEPTPLGPSGQPIENYAEQSQPEQYVEHPAAAQTENSAYNETSEEPQSKEVSSTEEPIYEEIVEESTEDSEPEYEEESEPIEEDAALIEGERDTVCYVSNGYLCCISLQPTATGVFPFISYVKTTLPNGPVSTGMNERIDKAIAFTMHNNKASSIDESQKIAAEALVKRARCGDQHAIAIISLVRTNANKNIPRAKQAFKYIQDYIANHPTDDTLHGEEPSLSVPVRLVDNSATRFANGPNLDKHVVGNLIRTFGGKRSRKRKLIIHGISNFGNETELTKLKQRLKGDEQALIHLGECIGRARAIQAIRKGYPIAILSKTAAWELGENVN